MNACQRLIRDHETTLKKLSERCATDFVQKVAAASSELLLLFDDILTVDDVQKGSKYRAMTYAGNCPVLQLVIKKFVFARGISCLSAVDHFILRL